MADVTSNLSYTTPTPPVTVANSATQVAAPSVLTSQDASNQTAANQAILTQFQAKNGGATAFQFGNSGGYDANGNYIAPATQSTNSGASTVTTTPTTNTNQTNTNTLPSNTTSSQTTQDQNDPTASFKANLAVSQASADALLSQQAANIAQYGQTLNNNTASMIANIQAQFESRKQAQAQLNQATLGGLTVAGDRAGRQRYANEIQTGILTAQESSGIKSLADLDAQEQSLILQAQAANNDKQFELLDKTTQALLKNNSDKEAQVLQLYQFSQQQEQLALSKLQEINNQANSDRNFALQQQQYQQSYNDSHGITGTFYQNPGSSQVYDAQTGKPLTYDEYVAKGGIGKMGGAFTDVQVVPNAAKQYPTGIIGEYMFYADQQQAAGKPALSFNDYQTMDANRVRKTGGSGAASTSLSDKQLLQQDQITTANNLASVIGKDGYVSPEDFKKAYRDWVTSGHDGNDFASLFGGYVNPADSQDYGNAFVTKKSSNN